MRGHCSRVGTVHGHYGFSQVPCAVGGTSLDEWQKGAPPSAHTDWALSLYDRLIARARAACGEALTSTATSDTAPLPVSSGCLNPPPRGLANQNISESVTSSEGSPSPLRLASGHLSASPSSSRLKALLWYQGESDADTEEHAGRYCERFERFLADVRADLGRPELPCVMVVITTADLPTTSFLSLVRRQQYEAAARVPRVVIVDSDGSKLQADGLHLTTDAQITVGKELATCFHEKFDTVDQCI
eukprot:jgi/Mesvir1/21686/Mv04106-RA.1